MNPEKNYSLVAKAIGASFDNPDLLQEALTHRSYLNEHRSYRLDHNERLEFLGDAVLELAVTEHLFKKYPNPEGELTSWRAALVNGDMLAKISRKIGLEKYLLMSRGESRDKGRAREYLLANAFEAVVGAIYLDKDYEAAKKFVEINVLVNLPDIIKNKLYLDPKSHFQEMAQDKVGITPSYKELKEEGPDHDKKFTVGVYLEDEYVAEGSGSSKQEAQRQAAQNALEVKGWK